MSTDNEPDQDYGYLQLLEDYGKLEKDQDLEIFIAMLIGINRTFKDLQRFQIVITKVIIQKEIAFIRTLEPGQVWSFKNMRNSFIGVVQRIVNRTVYMTVDKGQITHASACDFVERLG